LASLSAETASLYYGHKMTLSQANDIAEDWLSNRYMHSIDKAVVETAMLVRDRFFQTLIHFPSHVFGTIISTYQRHVRAIAHKLQRVETV